MKLFSLLFATSLLALPTVTYADSYYGDPDGLKTLQDSKIGQLQFSQHLPDWIKSEAEVFQYFRCHLKVDLSQANQTFRQVDKSVQSRLAEFRTIKEPFLNLAVQVFQIPFPFSGCIMFRETFFDHSRVSSANAKTIAQFTPETYGELIKQYKNVKNLEADYKKFEAMKLDDVLKVKPRENNNDFIKWEQFRRRQGPYYDQASPEEKVKGHEVAVAEVQNFLIHKTLIGEMKEYLWLTSVDPKVNRAKLFPNTRRGVYPRGTDLMPPTNFNRFIKNKMWVSAYNIYYIKQIILQANALFNPEGFQANQDPLAYLMVIAGSYNQGPAKLKALVQRQPAQGTKGQRSLKQWCRALSENTETKNYMLSVRRCLTQGIFSQPTNSNPGECQDKGSLPQTTDPCEPIQPVETFQGFPTEKTPSTK